MDGRARASARRAGRARPAGRQRNDSRACRVCMACGGATASGFLRRAAPDREGRSVATVGPDLRVRSRAGALAKALRSGASDARARPDATTMRDLGAGAARLRLALIAVSAKENGPSMDVVANMLYERLLGEHGAALQVDLIRPPMRLRASRIPGAGSARAAFTF